jgi:hypothetical protein
MALARPEGEAAGSGRSRRWVASRPGGPRPCPGRRFESYDGGDPDTPSRRGRAVRGMAVDPDAAGTPPSDGPDVPDATWAWLLHALRTPLTVALGRVQLLRRRLLRAGDPGRLNPELDVIEAALKRLAAIIDEANQRHADR